MKINYQKKLDEILDDVSKTNTVPKLLLHSCCAPCSSYVIEYLSSMFNITIYYYNPNIYPKAEYFKRLEEQKKFINLFPHKNNLEFLSEPYCESEFLNAIKGNENDKECSTRCFKCYRLRFEKTAQFAVKNKFDYFGSVLSISPHKNEQKLNEIGEELSDVYGIKYLYADFKKKDGYKRSLVLSQKYNLYRQNYCGCRFSQRDKSPDTR